MDHGNANRGKRAKLPYRSGRNLGLDPNMDSWPLDQNGIVQVLNSQNWDDLEWSGNFDEEDEAIGAAQSVRGYHTLEYLLFKDGQPRTVDGAK